MNLTEKQLVDILKELKERHAVTGVKMEFEAEGTRLEEAMRLKDVSSRAGLDMTLKIGGCEAFTDMYEAANLGVKHLVAPMIETPYALRKYHGAIIKAYDKEDQADMDFLFNLETATACENFALMLELPEMEIMNGIVLGRVDLTGSLGMGRGEVNNDQIFGICSEMAAKAKARGKAVVIGGSVSIRSMPFFKKFPAGHIDRFETRKIVFKCPEALQNTEKSFLKALEFELLWLKNKRNYYGRITSEDETRLVMMEERYRDAVSAAKGG
jgi:4-hydroxy-2-oxoheptanedioate aldolase